LSPRRLLAALLLLPAGAAPAAADPLVIDATPIAPFSRAEPERTRFGAFEFRGGLALASPDERFGGLSGLWLGEAGTRLVAVSDRGRWLTGRIRYEGTAPVAITDAAIEPVLGPGGKPVEKTRRFDTEGLAIGPQAAVVGVERAHEILRFPYRGEPGTALPRVAGAPMKLPPMPGLVKNRSIEAVALPSSGPLQGAVIAFAEDAVDDVGHGRAWIVGGATPGAFGLVRGAGDFDVTDAAMLPDGDLLILERHFSFLGGLRARVRRLAIGDIAPGAVVDGKILFEASLAQSIDNMEAMAVHVAGDGATVVTLVSDDNFSRLQRTVLLQFALVGEKPVD
jgi:hypothetical protein